MGGMMALRSFFYKLILNKIGANIDCIISAKILIEAWSKLFTRKKPNNEKDFGISYSEKTFNLYMVNCRSILNKKKSLEDIFENRNVDFGLMSKLNTKNPPKIIGYHKFVKHSSKKFHGVAIYISNQYQGKVQWVPDDSEGKFVHLIMKETVHSCI